MIERYQRCLFHYRQERRRSRSASRTQHSRLVDLKSFFRWLAQRALPALQPRLGARAAAGCDRRLPDRRSRSRRPSASSPCPTSRRRRACATVPSSRSSTATGMRRIELAQPRPLRPRPSSAPGLAIRTARAARTAWCRSASGRSPGSAYLEEVRPAARRAARRAARSSSTMRRRALQPGAHRLAAAATSRRAAIAQARLLPPLSPHLATLMLEGGADVRYIQEMLGHANLETTQIYTQVSIDKLQADARRDASGGTAAAHARPWWTRGETVEARSCSRPELPTPPTRSSDARQRTTTSARDRPGLGARAAAGRRAGLRRCAPSPSDGGESTRSRRRARPAHRPALSLRRASVRVRARPGEESCKGQWLRRARLRRRRGCPSLRARAGTAPGARAAPAEDGGHVPCRSLSDNAPLSDPALGHPRLGSRCARPLHNGRYVNLGRAQRVVCERH